MRTIITTFHGATNTRGARIKVTDGNYSAIFFPYDHAAACAHVSAFRAYARRFPERFEYAPGKWHKGHLPKGCVFVYDGDGVELSRIVAD